MNKPTKKKPKLEQLEVDEDDNKEQNIRKNKYMIKSDLIDSQSIEL